MCRMKNEILKYASMVELSLRMQILEMEILLVLMPQIQ